MSNFEESLQRLTAPERRATAFRRKLRHELAGAAREQSLTRWRRTALASAMTAMVLAVALAWAATAPGPPAATLGELDAFLAEHEISAASDREFLEAFYARRGDATTVRSIDDERLVAVRAFTMSDGRKMVVYTEVGEGESQRSTIPVDDRLAMLASRPVQTF